MAIKISGTVTYHTYATFSMGFGFVNMRDSQKASGSKTVDGDTIFAHKLSEDVDYLKLTEEQKAEIKADCDALVKLLGKFYHESEYFEVKE